MTAVARMRTPWWARDRGRASPTAYVALAGFTFVLLLSPQATYPALGALRLAFMTAVVAVVAQLSWRTARGLPLLVVPRGTGPAIALGAWAVVTAPFSLWPGGSVEVFTDVFAKSLVICWLLPQVVDSEARLGRLVAGLCAAGAILALSGLSHLGGGFMSGQADAVKQLGGYEAPLTRNSNDLALMLNLLVPLSYALLRIARSLVARLALAALVLVEIAAIIVTFSRAGFITLAAVWTWHGLRTLRGRARVLVAVLAAGLLVAPAFLPSGYREYLGTTLDADADLTGSAQARWADAVAATTVISDQPLVGVGLGQSVLAITRQTGTWRMVHNVYLQVAADLGLPGLALFLAFLASCLGAVRSVCRSLAASPRPEPAPVLHLARGLELSLCVFIVAGMFHPAAYHFYAYYIGGLALATRSIHEAVSR